MDATQHRANLVDQKLKDLNKTLRQLQQSLPIIQSSNASLNPAFEPKPKRNEHAILCRSDALKILSQLKSIKNKVLEYEAERIKEKQHLATVRNNMRNELLSIKKQLLTDNFRETPTQFRTYLQSQLQLLKQELIKVKNNNNCNINDCNKQVLEKVKAELIVIRGEMTNKLSKLAQYQEFEAEFSCYKEKLNLKLLKIKNEVEKYEEENEEYRSGKRIASLLQNALECKLNILKENVFRIETENKTYRMHSGGSDPLSEILSSLYVTTIDMHIGGEPLRIVVGGIPSLNNRKTKTLLEKRQLMMSNYDYYRKFLMHEPRGHFDMYGVIIVDVDEKYKSVADFGVLFMHNEGYSSMCGHAVIGLGRYAIDFGLIKNNNNNNNNIVRIQCPCGIVTVNVEIDNKTNKSTGNVSFISAPGWAEYISTSIQLDQFGKIEIDIGYGGAYYVICPSTRFNLNVRDSSIDDLINISTLIKQTVIKKLSLSNPDSSDLEFLYGTILTDGINSVNEASANVCVFADRQVDRCPTGSGVIARLAVDFAKKNIKIGQKRKFIGKTGSIFQGEIVKVLQNYKDKKNAVIVKVTGSAKYIGRSQFYLEDGDELGRGFLMK